MPGLPGWPETGRGTVRSAPQLPTRRVSHPAHLRGLLSYQAATPQNPAALKMYFQAGSCIPYPQLREGTAPRRAGTANPCHCTAGHRCSTAAQALGGSSPPTWCQLRSFPGHQEPFCSPVCVCPACSRCYPQRHWSPPELTPGGWSRTGCSTARSLQSAHPCLPPRFCRAFGPLNL